MTQARPSTLNHPRPLYRITGEEVVFVFVKSTNWQSVRPEFLSFIVCRHVEMAHHEKASADVVGVERGRESFGGMTAGPGSNCT